jgi:phosphatidylglycerophosphate synthase
VRFLPNLLTGARLLLIPLLWVLALRGEAARVGIGVVAAWVTDALDGYLARRLNAATPLGSHFDSIADALLFVSTLCWIALLRPEFLREQAVPLAVWAALGVSVYLVGWIRFRRLADVHLYSAKAANFVGLAFASWLLGFGSYPAAFWYFTLAVCLVGAGETLLVVLTQHDPDRPRATLLEDLFRGRSAS